MWSNRSPIITVEIHPHLAADSLEGTAYSPIKGFSSNSLCAPCVVFRSAVSMLHIFYTVLLAPSTIYAKQPPIYIKAHLYLRRIGGRETEELETLSAMSFCDIIVEYTSFRSITEEERSATLAVFKFRFIFIFYFSVLFCVWRTWKRAAKFNNNVNVRGDRQLGGNVCLVRQRKGHHR